MSTKAQVEACYIYADRLLSRGLRPNQIVHLMSESNMTEVTPHRVVELLGMARTGEVSPTKAKAQWAQRARKMGFSDVEIRAARAARAHQHSAAGRGEHGYFAFVGTLLLHPLRCGVPGMFVWVVSLAACLYGYLLLVNFQFEGVLDAFGVLCAMLVCLSIMAVPAYVMRRAMNPVPDDPASLEDLSGANDFVVIKTFEQQDFADTLSFSLESEGFLTETKATEMGWELSVPSAQEARARKYLTVIERGIEDL